MVVGWVGWGGAGEGSWGLGQTITSLVSPAAQDTQPAPNPCQDLLPHTRAHDAALAPTIPRPSGTGISTAAHKTAGCLTRHAVFHHLRPHRAIHLLLALPLPKHACRRRRRTPTHVVKQGRGGWPGGTTGHLGGTIVATPQPRGSSAWPAGARMPRPQRSRSKVAVKGSGLPASASTTVCPPSTSRHGSTPAAVSRLLGGRTRT